jgi:AcrR family transcriptional regulator
MDNTKQKILEAATEVFASKGFSGASISTIAKKAKINQSLIYHHIGNKQTLWKEVKKNLIASLETTNTTYKSLRHFIHHITEQRIQVYEREPKLLRIIQWQMLEDKKNLIGSNQLSPSTWINNIIQLQDKGEIRSDYSADLIAVYIYSIINSVIIDPFNIFAKDYYKKSKYTKMVNKEIINTLKCNQIANS